MHRFMELFVDVLHFHGGWKGSICLMTQRGSILSEFITRSTEKCKDRSCLWYTQKNSANSKCQHFTNAQAPSSLKSVNVLRRFANTKWRTNKYESLLSSFFHSVLLELSHKRHLRSSAPQTNENFVEQWPQLRWKLIGHLGSHQTFTSMFSCARNWCAHTSVSDGERRHLSPQKLLTPFSIAESDMNMLPWWALLKHFQIPVFSSSNRCHNIEPSDHESNRSF